MDLLNRLVVEGAMDGSDLNLLFATDSVDDALEYLKRNAIDRFALRAPKASRWLGELSAPTGALTARSTLSR
jgi:hypothetical protein